MSEGRDWVGARRSFLVRATARDHPVPMPITPNWRIQVNHFGIALGAIIVMVIGGAFVLDRFSSSSSSTTTAESTAVVAPAQPEPSVVDKGTNGGSATSLPDVAKEP